MEVDGGSVDASAAAAAAGAAGASGRGGAAADLTGGGAGAAGGSSTKGPRRERGRRDGGWGAEAMETAGLDAEEPAAPPELPPERVTGLLFRLPEGSAWEAAAKAAALVWKESAWNFAVEGLVRLAPTWRTAALRSMLRWTLVTPGQREQFEAAGNLPASVINFAVGPVSAWLKAADKAAAAERHRRATAAAAAAVAAAAGAGAAAAAAAAGAASGPQPQAEVR